ncbi:DNA-directed RNA polymerase subunit B [Candidatus Geothermarchaeota archaeon]|nr:MAG: DNA-directed RNA polymerase subunit B [Candidatus Geothermarchaeota archaeon]HEW93381.1 DNA-directed RNA polymerase subunit B [Thermoprotei archaeon]
MRRLDIKKYLVSKPLEYDTWPVVEAMIREFGLAKQHIDSYNEFIEKGIKEIIEENKIIKIIAPNDEIIYEITDVRVDRPRIKDVDGSPLDEERGYIPAVCRLRGLTYAAPIIATIKRKQGGFEYIEDNVEIGHIPVMVKSKICVLHGKSKEELIRYGEDPNDPGGYFIINGSERAIVALEDLASNSIITRVEKVSNTKVYISMILSVKGSLRNHVTVTVKKNNIYVTIPFTLTPIPFPIVMKALGVVKEGEIAEAVSRREEIIEELYPVLKKYESVSTQEDALLYIGNRTQAAQQPIERRKNRARHILDKYLFPHVGIGPEYRLRKAYLLAEMVRRAIELKLGWRNPDDRDHYANKRLRLAGPLLGQIFAKSLKSLLKDLHYNITKYYLYKSRIQLSYLVRSSKITHRFNHALATGTWTQRTTGVTQMLDRTNYLSTLSHLRRIQSPLSRSRPQFEAREVHASHLGRICPVESPEGQNIGLVKNLALSAIVSNEYPPDKIYGILMEEGMVKVEEADDRLWESGARVFLNGDFIGFVSDPMTFVERLRGYRRRGLIPPDISIAVRNYNKDKLVPEVYIETSSARILRPLIRVVDGKPLLTHEHIRRVAEGKLKFTDLLKIGVIELIDANEEYNVLTAFFPEELTKDHTHLELSPFLFLGITASVIPFAEHNQSPRNSYEAAMAKQALGIPYTNIRLRMDTRGHLLEYPQMPIVQTRVMDLIGLNDRPVGQNLVVAIMSYESYNMEDAVVINKAAVDRGLFRSFFYKTYESTARLHGGGVSDRFEKPGEDVKNYIGEDAYRSLEEDGLPYLEAKLEKGDVVIGKTGPPRFLVEYEEAGLTEQKRDYSTTLDQFTGVVDRVVLTLDKEGQLTALVKIREHRVPELGDKVASRHGQKGVVGLLAPPEDMPYTADGIIPDLLINPHAFPSRMTVGQFLESIAGKYGALAGRFVDGTPFISYDYEDLGKLLKSMGFEPMGTEVMYDGRTGKKFKADIFVGIVYYQKLHHMVADKMHARARGPVQILTRQPTEGRSRDGGLRIGDMEKDVFVAYGASSIIKERLLDASDRTTIFVCTKCGLEGYYDARNRKLVCPVHGPDAPLVPVNVSYAFKLLLDELKSMAIYPRIYVEEVI